MSVILPCFPVGGITICNKYGVMYYSILTFWSSVALHANSGKDPVTLEQELLDLCKTNIVGNVHLFNLFLPLILKGQKKKVIAITSGMADIEFIARYEIEAGGPYAVSKAGANAVVAKYSAEYAKDGVLFMSICPGMVETGNAGDCEIPFTFQTF